MPSPFDEAFLRSQQAYYDARAPEYDEWWLRHGRYDHGPEANAVWFREQEELYSALTQAGFQGEVPDPQDPAVFERSKLSPSEPEPLYRELLTLRRELPPELEGATQERDVRRVLEVGQADDPRQPMR